MERQFWRSIQVVCEISMDSSRTNLLQYLHVYIVLASLVREMMSGISILLTYKMPRKDWKTVNFLKY